MLYHSALMTYFSRSCLNVQTHNFMMWGLSLTIHLFHNYLVPDIPFHSNMFIHRTTTAISVNSWQVRNSIPCHHLADTFVIVFWNRRRWKLHVRPSLTPK